MCSKYIMSLGQRLLWLIILLSMTAGMASYAQRYESQQFVILDADGRDLLDEAGRLWDPEDGVWKPASTHLRHRNDLEVFVTNEVCADSIVQWSKTNSERNNRLVRAFVNEYRQRDWLLHPHGDVYNLADINPIAEAIYGQYQYIIDWWCMQNADMRGAYSVALVLHPREGGPFEMIVLSEKVTLYDGDDPLCPLYYKNRVMLENVEKVHRVERPHNPRRRAQSRGMILSYDERFDLSHPSDLRLLVERRIDLCGFERDFTRLDARLAGNATAQAMCMRLLDHSNENLGDTAYMLDPMVFAGKRYLMTAQRQFRGMLLRDTVEHFRQNTERIFSETLVNPPSLLLSPKAGTVTLPFIWKMPDQSRFYRIVHNEYLHDHIHTDTLQAEECDCERQIPLQFLRVASQPAGFDCPPRKQVNTSELVSFRPRSRGELQDATYQLSLSFDKNSHRLDLSLGTNQEQLDSLVQKAFDITHSEEGNSIQQVGIVGISSPEGRYEGNIDLAHRRSESIISRLRAMGGADLRYARFEILKDSVAPWSAVADLIDQLHPEEHDLAERIRHGSTHESHPVIDQALEQLRQVQVTYAYKAILDVPSATILNRFWRGDDTSHWPAYYFYVLLTSDQLTWSEKLQLSQRLLSQRESQVRRYLRDLSPTDSYGLVLPLAANYLAIDAIREGRYDAHILAPFIDHNVGIGNQPYYTRSDLDNPAKFVNLDVLLYNQVLMLCGIGTDEALDEAYSLAEILENTRTVSDAFLQHYHPEVLRLIIDCQSGDFLDDEAKAEAIRQTNVCNLFVINMARIFHQVDGDLQSIASDDYASSLLTECQSLLPRLQDQMRSEPASLYFTAVTEAWLAESIGASDRDEHQARAVAALVALFGKEDERGYISRLQGDSYVRGFYRNQKQQNEGFDLFLEAVEQYIQNNCR